jgi:hypothetical protein
MLLEALEPRQMLTVGYIEMAVEQSAVEGVRKGVVSFTKHLTDPEQDYPATVHFTVGFMQEPDGNGGTAESEDTNYHWGNYTIGLGVGVLYKDLKITALLDDLPETMEGLFFYITSVDQHPDWDWNPGDGVTLPVFDAIPYNEIVPTAYFCGCSCGCASVTHEADAGNGYLRANTQPRNAATNDSPAPDSGSAGGMQQAAVGGYSGGLSYNSVSAAVSLVGEIVQLSSSAGSASAITSKVILYPDTDFEVELDTFYYDPATVGTSSDGVYQFVRVIDDPSFSAAPALRVPYRLIVEEVGNNVWHVSQGVVNRRGNAFPEFGVGWAPPFLQKLIFDPL